MTTTITKEELQFAIKMNRALHSSVQPIERLKEYHYSTYIKYFSNKESGFIWNRMNTNGTMSWKWFENSNDAIDYMNGYSSKK